MKVFISYPRIDDGYGVVSDFRDHLANELEILVPGSSVFQDLEAIRAGFDVSDSIKQHIRNADVLVILLAPAWLDRRWCRLEYETFITKERDSGWEPRVLPILWVRAEATDSVEEDAIAAALAKLQYEDWSELRHHNWDSPLLRARLAALARTTANLAQGIRR